MPLADIVTNAQDGKKAAKVDITALLKRVRCFSYAVIFVEYLVHDFPLSIHLEKHEQICKLLSGLYY